jgi:hypothetical protein
VEKESEQNWFWLANTEEAEFERKVENDFENLLPQRKRGSLWEISKTSFLREGTRMILLRIPSYIFHVDLLPRHLQFFSRDAF